MAIKPFMSLIAMTTSLVISQASLAQLNSTVIGGGSLARECFQKSQSATLTGSGSRIDIEVCDQAIFKGSLNKRELASTYANRGIIYASMQDYKAAYKDYNKAIELEADLPEAYINRGNLWLTLQEFQRAVDDYDRAIEIGSPSQPVAKLNRGLAYEYLGNLESAEADYLAALELKEDWNAAQDKLKRVQRKIRAKALDQP